MTKDSIEMIIALVALIVGGAGLIVGSFALALIVGVKNSTHQVLWKNVEPPAEKEEEDDPFIYGPPLEQEENPNKKLKNKNDDEDFADLSDPEVTSNDWR